MEMVFISLIAIYSDMMVTNKIGVKMISKLNNSLATIKLEIKKYIIANISGLYEFYLYTNKKERA